MKAKHVEIMKMMGNTRCLAIMLHLSHGRYSLEQLVDRTGYPATNISYHIKRLRDKSLIVGDRDGYQVYYEVVSDPGIRSFIADIAETFANGERVAA